MESGVMVPDDDLMLAAYNETLALAASLLKALGCDDPKKATTEQVNAVVAVLIELARARHGELPQLTAKQIMNDHRKLTRLKKARQN